MRLAQSAFISALLASSAAAQAELPSPLFCETVAVCDSGADCTGLDETVHFVLRRTEGEWLMHASARGPDQWVVLGQSKEDILHSAPAGARIAVVAMGLAEDDTITLHQHDLGAEGLSEGFQRHTCRTADAARTA